MKKRLKKLNFYQFVGNKLAGTSNQNYYAEDSFDFLALAKQWENIVGEKLTPHTSPKSLKNGTLTILVRHSVFASELKSLSPILIRKIGSVFPSLKNQLKDIRFTTSEIFFDNRETRKDNIKTSESNQNSNAYDPEYAQTKFEAGKVFNDVDDEFKELFVSLYIQNNQSK